MNPSIEIFNQFDHHRHPPPSDYDEEIVLASSQPKKWPGRFLFKETRLPMYHGVRRRNKDKWVCEFWEPNRISARPPGEVSLPQLCGLRVAGTGSGLKTTRLRQPSEVLPMCWEAEGNADVSPWSWSGSYTG